MRLMLIIVGAIAFGSNAIAQTYYTVVDCGLQFGDPSYSRVCTYDINENGDVVGEAINAAGRRRAFVYLNGALLDLGTFGLEDSSALAINNAQQVLIRAYGPDGRAFIWQNGLVTEIVDTIGGANVSALDINDAGQVVGVAATGPSSGAPFIWVAGVMQNLGTFGGTSGTAYGINATGQVIGWATDTAERLRPFLYSNGTMTDLGTLGGNEGQAIGINDFGDVVGRAQTDSGEWHACVWRQGTVIDLHTSTFNATMAFDINNGGQIVGEMNRGSEGFIYDPTVGIRTANSALWPPDPVDSVAEVRSISNSGLIAATGSIPGPVPHPVVLRPVCIGDLNGNGSVDLGDLSILLGWFGGPSISADLDGDGWVTLADLSILLSHFGQSCP